jgi:adenine-specific DNA-methyltransferase
MPDEKFEEAFRRVKERSAQFHKYRSAYTSPNYSEAQARQDFIDKFLIALGWDVAHEEQTNPFEQEVKVEKNLSSEHAQRRADYALHVAPNYRDVRCFVEAKKPCAPIDTADNCFQVNRYGWNAQTPIALLTSFEQLRVIDCRYKPDIDTAIDRIVLRATYLEYQDREEFAKIYYLFSRAAIAQGSLEKFAAELPRKRGKAVQRGLFKGGYQAIDDAFLAQLDRHREELARGFKATNPQLDGEALTELTQRTLDRLVFLRFLEDRLLETKEKVAHFGEHGSPWKDFVAASGRLNAIYNGIVFRKHPLLDSDSFVVDDEMFSDLCEELSDTNSPYNFDVIPIHILGSIYERFLGRVIVVTGKGARVEDKPEVRRAGGVYYTPEYIVRYIVENTVAKLIEGKTPAQISRLRFIDISCGSGSFLLGVFDALLDYHRRWYNANPDRAGKDECIKHDDGVLHLTLRKKREILLNNIFGVDIDHQAVEVAQLSLYLKLLEAETTASARNHQLEFHETLLPSLSANIVCGNSIIEPSYIADAQHDLLGDDDAKRVNVFDFRTAFPAIMNQGGFDAVVGNPPYGASLSKDEREYLAEKYPAVADYESAQYFLERIGELTRPTSRSAYIVPNTMFLNVHAGRFRERLLQNFHVEGMADLSGVDVFPGATVRTAIPVLVRPRSTKATRIVRLSPSGSFMECGEVDLYRARNSDGGWIEAFSEASYLAFQRKVVARTVPLGEIVDVSQGLIPYDKYRGHDEHTIKNRIWHADERRDNTFKRELQGGDVTRYNVTWNGEQWISYGPWLGAPRDPKFFQKPRLLFREITDPTTGFLHVAYTDEEFYNNPGIINCVLGDEQKYSLLYLLGCCNSRFIANWHFTFSPKAKKGVFPKILVNDVRKLPIPRVDFSNKPQVQKHDALVSLATNMIDATSRLRAAVTDRDQEFFRRRCVQLDREIDELVLGLYGVKASEMPLASQAV